MNFNTIPPVPFATGNNEIAEEPRLGSGTAAVSDNTGQLRFYAQLDTVWDKNGNVMPNGNGLIGNLPVYAFSGGPATPPQDPSYFNGASLVVPYPGAPDKYIVFSKTGLIANPTVFVGGIFNGNGNDSAAGRLYYSVVDMSLRGGLGDVVPGQKGIQIDSLLADRLVAVTGPSCNIWVLSMKIDGSAIHAFEITPEGINTLPVVSPCDTAIATGMSFGMMFSQTAGGCMTVSPDGTRLAVSLSGLVRDFTTQLSYGGGFQLYDFNAATGVATNQINVLVGPGVPNESALFGYSVINLCFSPDATKMYVPHGWFFSAGIWQFDISSGLVPTIIASKVELDPNGYLGHNAAMRLGSDNKVYITGTTWGGLLGSDVLHRIENPNVTGPSALLALGAVSLAPGTESLYGLGNIVVRSPPSDTTFTGHTLTLCAGGSSLGLSVPQDPAYTYLWDDGSTGNTRTVTTGGNFRVVYGPRCPKLVDSFKVEEVDVRFDFGSDTVICGRMYPFDLKGTEVPGATYLWQDGSTGHSFNVSGGGVYSLTVTKRDCSASDEIRIDNFDVFQHLGPDIMFCAGTPFNVRLEGRVPDGARVLWSTGVTTPAIDVSQPGTYGIKVTQDVCEGMDSITIRNTELCDCIAFMPNAFSPNGDGLNDIFAPLLETGCSLNEYSFDIFNRWGQRVYSTANPGKGWDGRFNGQPVDPGTYWFTISFEKGTHRQVFTRKGDLVLIK
ncbi:gliding motility-associated C-terminal domain-containing protein [Taibaiella chishuiensis]|nr:gliding motility-associated C-terminal domain-containing protein [Taibaiella chishuiensis]